MGGTAHHCEESSESAQDWIRALSVVVGGYDMPVRSIEDAWWGWLEAGVQRRKARPRDGPCVWCMIRYASPVDHTFAPRLSYKQLSPLRP